MPKTELRLIPSFPEDYQVLQAGGPWKGHTLPEGGLEPAEVLAMLARWSARLNVAQGWGSWLAVEGGEVVASLAVKEPLAGGAVEIGYGVAPARRGRGIATAAVLLVLEELAARGLMQVTAETSPGNPASGRVLQKAGFAVVGERVDPEDGPLILWAREIG